MTTGPGFRRRQAQAGKRDRDTQAAWRGALRPLVLLGAIAAALSLAACGGTHTKKAASIATSNASSASAPHRQLTTSSSAPAAAGSTQALQNDNDNDKPGDEDPDNSHDDDSDAYSDYKPLPNNHVYHDQDDSKALAFGTPPSGEEMRSIGAVVKRYYAVALAGSGAEGCSMIDASLVKAVPLDYGVYGPTYVRGGKTCATVLSRLFAHEHAHLPAVIQVTEARLKGNVALAFFGARHMPASYIGLKREQGTWMISQLLGAPLS